MASHTGECINMMHEEENFANRTNSRMFVDAKLSGVDLTREIRRIGHIGDGAHRLTSASIERQLNFVRGSSGSVG